MRLTILTVGSRGDVQPFLALGLELVGAGHEVRVATHPKYAPLVRRVGLPFAPLAEGRISEGPETPEGRRWTHSGGRRLPTWVGLLQDARSVARWRLADALAACRDADAILAGDLATLLGWQMSEHYGRPLIRAGLYLPGRQDPFTGTAPAPVRQGLWRLARPWLNAVRRDVGLAPLPAREPFRELDRQRTLVLHAHSPAVCPPPDPRRDWVKATGYWVLGQEVDPEPSPELVAFLAAGDAPVCIGFGSMLDAEPVKSTTLAVEALQRSGRRGVLIRGQYGLLGADLPPSVFAVDSVSHDWLFARCAAVVHHAGAGTTAATVRAGVPSVPVPHMPDQVRMARRIHRLGVATIPIAHRRLSVVRLHEAIAAATDDHMMGHRAASLGRKVCSENGTARAVELLESHLGQDRSPRLKVTAPRRIEAEEIL